MSKETDSQIWNFKNTKYVQENNRTLNTLAEN
jgi:hypothetical protein